MAIEYYKKTQFSVLNNETGELSKIECLIPVAEKAKEKFSKLKNDVTYLCDIKKERNPLFHKKYMKLIRFTFDNIPEKYSKTIKTFEQLRSAIEWDVGNVEYFWSLPVSKNVFDENKFLSMLDKNKLYSYDVIKAGMEFSRVINTEPELIMKPKSISFDKMKQDEFEKLYTRVLDMCSKILDLSNDVIKYELDLFGD